MTNPGMFRRSDYEKFRASLLSNASKLPSTSTSLPTQPPGEWNINIADGFQEDCEMFITEFKKKQSIRFNHFFDLWKEMKFELVYSGRPSVPELFEFAEEAITIASKYLFFSKNNDDYQTSISGLYLVYCLHNAHPVAKKTRIRVIPSSVFILQELRLYALDNGHVDVLYILSSLLKDGIFRFVAKRREYGLEKSYRKYITHNNLALIDDLHDTEIPSFDGLIDAHSGILNEVDAALQEYYKAKCDLPGAELNAPPKKLNYVVKDFAKELKRSFQDLISTDTDDPPPDGRQKKKVNLGRVKERVERLKISSLSVSLMNECFKSPIEDESESEDGRAVDSGNLDDQTDMPVIDENF